MKFNLLFILSFLSVTFVSSQQIDVNVVDGGLVYISPDTYMYVSNNGDYNISANGETIMDSNVDGFSSLYIDGVSTGEAEYRRYAPNTTTTNDLISAPVFGEAFNVFATRNNSRPDLSGADVLPAGTIGAGTELFGPFEPGDSNYTEYMASDTTPIELGRGYRTASTSGTTLSFRGSISTSDLAYATVTSSGQFANAHLIGNPYTTFLNSENLVNGFVASGIFPTDFQAAYIFPGSVEATTGAGSSTSSWVALNLANIATLLDAGVTDAIPSKYLRLPPGQAFFVFVETAGNVPISETAREVTTEGFNAMPEGRGSAGKNAKSNNSTEQSSAIYLRILNETNATFNRANLFFYDRDEVTTGVDPGWDTGELSLSSLMMSTMILDGSSTNPFEVQSVPTTQLSDVTERASLAVQLYVRTPSPGDYKIDGIGITKPNDIEFYLHDKLENTITDLSLETYDFNTTTSLNGVGRFELITNYNLTAQTLSTDEVSFDSIEVKSISGNKEIKVYGRLDSDVQLKVYDVSGRLVKNYEVNNSGANTHSVDASQLSVGPYIVTLSNDNGQSKTAKIVIN